MTGKLTSNPNVSKSKFSFVPGGSLSDTPDENKFRCTGVRQARIKANDDGPTVDYLPESGGTMSGDINMDGNFITNLPVPQGSGDAVSKSYLNNYLPRDGSLRMKGSLDMSYNYIGNLSDGTNISDAANMRNVNNAVGAATLVIENNANKRFVKKAGDTLTGNLNLGGNRLVNLGGPLSAKDAATKEYADLHDITKGGTITGTLDFLNTGKIIDLPEPVGYQDAATLNTVIKRANDCVKKSGGTYNSEFVFNNLKTSNFSSFPIEDTFVINWHDCVKNFVQYSSATGALNMGGNQITYLKDPTGMADAATKHYSDDQDDITLEVAKAYTDKKVHFSHNFSSNFFDLCCLTKIQIEWGFYPEDCQFYKQSLLKDSKHLIKGSTPGYNNLEQNSADWQPETIVCSDIYDGYFKFPGGPNSTPKQMIVTGGSSCRVGSGINLRGKFFTVFMVVEQPSITGDTEINCLCGNASKGVFFCHGDAPSITSRGKTDKTNIGLVTVLSLGLTPQSDHTVLVWFDDPAKNPLQNKWVAIGVSFPRSTASFNDPKACIVVNGKRMAWNYTPDLSDSGGSLEFWVHGAGYYNHWSAVETNYKYFSLHDYPLFPEDLEHYTAGLCSKFNIPLLE